MENIEVYKAIGMALIVGVFIWEWIKKTPDSESLMRVDLLALAKFLVIMFVVTTIRYMLIDYAIKEHPEATIETIWGLQSTLEMIDLYKLGLVFWEDAFFVFPIAFVIKRTPKYVWIPFTFAMSLFFGFGHIYQGIWAVFLTSLYPYFVSYKSGMKWGFGTVMIAHVLFDAIFYFFVLSLPYIFNI